MEKFIIDTSDGKNQSINRTIRLKADLYDQLERLNEETGVSLNKLINQCVAYALKNMIAEDE